MTFCDVSHIVVTEKNQQPIPYHFQYAAGRAPGHVDSKYLILFSVDVKPDGSAFI